MSRADSIYDLSFAYRNSTRGHQGHILHSLHNAQFLLCCCQAPINWTGVSAYLSASRDSLIPTLMWKFFQQLLCHVSFKQIQIKFFLTKTLSSAPHGMFTYENTWRFIIAGPLGYCHQTIESVSRNWWNLSAMYIKLWYQNSKYFLLHPKMISIKCAKHRVVKNQLGQRDKCQWKST